MLPALIPLSGRSFDWGFEYDFIAKSSCEEGILLLISEEMRRLIQQNIPLETLEMVPQNAYSFLHKKQPLQASFARDFAGNIVPLCKVKDFYDICPCEMLASSRDVPAFALYELLFLPDSIVRIRGIASSDKKALKTYLKLHEQAKENDPVKRAEELNLITLIGQEAVWLPKGLEYKKELEKKLGCKEGFEEIYSDSPFETVHYLYERNKRQKLPLPYRYCQDVVRNNEDADGLFLVPHALSTVQYSYIQPQKLQEELISSLQFIKQIASILGMKESFILCHKGKEKEPNLVAALSSLGYPYEVSRSDATQIELHISDLRQRSWPLSKLVLRHENVPLIECVPVLSYERLVALLLERGEQIKTEE